jgi:hypothetical protein
MSGSISAGQKELVLIEYCLRLEYLLAIASDTVREFCDSLAGELVQLEKIQQLLGTKAGYLREPHSHEIVAGMIVTFAAINTAYHTAVRAVRWPSPDGRGAPTRATNSLPAARRTRGCGVRSSRGRARTRPRTGDDANCSPVRHRAAKQGSQGIGPVPPAHEPPRDDAQGVADRALHGLP